MNRVCKNRKALDWAYTEKLKKYFPLAVVLCDLNGLKEINDQKGHDAGDKFIVQTAQTLKSVFGKRHVYRLGGDEFIAVLPNITHPAFQKLLETAKSQLGDTASLGTTISGTKDDFYGYDTEPPAEDMLVSELGDKAYLTVFFEGDQSGVPMYVELASFTDGVYVTIGTNHLVG